MAKQAGIFFIEKTLGGICFYKMNGVYYARSKSTLSGKRVRTAPVFKKTMYHAQLLARASQRASALYKALPASERRVDEYRRLTAVILQQLKKEPGGES